MLCRELNVNCQNAQPPCTNTKSPIEDFLGVVLPKLCPQVELKNNEIRKNQNKDILLRRPLSLGMCHNVEIYYSI